MSGHSQWSSIKHQKSLVDAKRGKIFSKISRQISIAAKEGDKNPESNPKLRMAIDYAKKHNMPKENIERAIKKGTGELAGEKLEQFIFEAIGPGNSAIIIEGITDNRNRTLGEIKQILSSYNGKLANEGSLRWMFQRKGIIEVNVENNEREKLELFAIEAGAEDISFKENILEINTKPEDLEKVKKNLEEKGVELESSSLDWVSKEEIEIEEKEKQSNEKLFSALDENDDIQELYSNIKL